MYLHYLKRRDYFYKKIRTFFVKIKPKVEGGSDFKIRVFKRSFNYSIDALNYPSICCHCILNEVIESTYSGSRYNPSWTMNIVDSREGWLLGTLFDNPKSVTLACNSSFNKMFPGLTFPWIMGGLQPSCKYSSPSIQIPV